MVCAAPGNRFALLLEVAVREMHALDGDALWREELARAKQWLAARESQREARQSAILGRVNAHVHFAHAQQRKRELEADEAEDALPDVDLSLDFLNVDAEDIKSLLESEAARAAEAVAAEAAAAVAVAAATSASAETPVVELQQEQLPVQQEKPLEMPTHLLAKKSPPKLYASIAKSAHLQPKFVMQPLRQPPQATKRVSVTVLASVALEEDAGVAELMNELDLDISDGDHHLPPAPVSSTNDEEEESKSEELAQAASAALKPASAMDDLARLVFQTSGVLAKKGRNAIRDASDESDNDEKKGKRASSGGSVDPDLVADEMRGWVTGYRDPEVLRRKEAMSRRVRRPTSRFGVSSVEEQMSINKAAKYYVGEDVDGSSDSESEDSTGSDFAPADDADDRDDQVSEVELLSDDYLDDGERASASRTKPQRRRLRNKHRDSEGAKASKPRQKKTKNASKVVGGGSSSEPKISPPRASTTADASAGRHFGTSERRNKPPRAAEPTARQRPTIPDSDEDHETIDLLSSDEATSDAIPSTAKKVESSGDGSDRLQRTPGGVLVSLPSQPKSIAQKQESPVATKEMRRAAQSKTLIQKTPEGVHLKEGVKPSREIPKPAETIASANQGDKTWSPDGTHDLAGSAPAVSSDSVAKKNVGAEPHPVAAVQTSVDDAKQHKSVEPSKSGSEVSVKAAEGGGSRALTKALLVEHTMRESLNAKESETGAAPAEASDDVSEADTLDFDDVEEMSDEPIHEFRSPNTRQEDLGLSDADNDDDKEDNESHKAVVAPNDDEYEQFFADTPLRKQKLKEQQERKAAEAASANESTGSANASKTTPTSELNSTVSEASGNGVKNSVTTATAAAIVLKTTGSNGLRKKTKPGVIATTTVMKGKYQQTRRSTKVIVEETPGRGKRSVSGIYGNRVDSMIGVKKSRFSEPLVQGPHSSSVFTAEFLSAISDPDLDRGYQRNGRFASSSTSIDKKKQRDGDEEERYLSYGSKKPSGGDKSSHGKDSDDEPLSVSVRGAKAKDPTGSSKQDVTSKGWSFSSAVASNENVDLNPVTKAPEFPRDRQMDIYDALHIEDQSESGLTSRDLRGGEFKRPTAFKKVQEEKEKRGISFVPRETYLENLPIPKKKKLPGQQPPTRTSPVKPTPESRDYNKRSSTGMSLYTEKASHYGPSTGVEPLSSKNKSMYSSNDRSFSSKGKVKGRNNKFNSRRSFSPPSRRRSDDFDTYRGGRGKDGQRRHGRSRSPSPRQNDRYKSSSDTLRKRHRSSPRSRSRDRNDDDRDRSRSSKDARDVRDGRRDKSPSPSTAGRGSSESSRKRSRSMERSGDKSSTSQTDDRSDPAKKPKPRDPRTRTPTDIVQSDDSAPPPGALFEDGSGDDMYISDSDNENEGGGKAADIRFDLESVDVDTRHLKRRVYVAGMTAMMSEDELEELFAPFGIETDRETGFPAIDVYLCQRSHRPRGDACVTFTAEEGARSAAEELNAKIFKNCKLDVLVMTLPIQRLLSAQLHTPRESWKCAGSDCRADVSIWNNKCDKCFRKRIFGPSRVRVTDTDWLCSICFTANADRGVACSTCSASLPPTDRAQFYSK